MSAIPILVAAMFMLATLDSATQTPPSAEQLLTKAKAAAAAEHKNIFVVFDASW